MDARLHVDEKYYSGEDIFCSKALQKWGTQNQQDIHISSKYPVTTSARKFDQPHRIVLQLAISLIPFSTRFRMFSGYWYNRY
jgi:hypothetical protein